MKVVVTNTQPPITIAINDNKTVMISCPDLDQTEFPDTYDEGYYKGQADSLYNMLLAHVLSDIDVTTEAYSKGIQTALDNITGDSYGKY